MKKRRPRKKTIETMEFIKENVEDEFEILKQKIIDKYECSDRHARWCIDRYKEEGEELIAKYGVSEDSVPVHVFEVDAEDEVSVTSSSGEIVVSSHAERLPATEAELKEYRRKTVTSPEARAMRIAALNNCVHTESGIARIKALELLEEMTKEYLENTNEEEPLFFNVFDDSKIPDKPKENEEK